MKMQRLLFICGFSLDAAADSVVSNASDRCTATEEHRVDCFGTQDQCLAKNCCWKPVDPNPDNLPWCYKPADGPTPAPTPPPPPPSPAECKVDDYDKVDCNQGSESACYASGCCWKPAGAGSATPWCYFKKGVGPTVPHCHLKSSPQEPFSEAEVATIRELFAANLDIQGSGEVVAAPDHNTGPGGDYYYAWMRDGALSMNAFLETTPNLADVETKMEHWVAWVERSVQQSDPHGDIMTEPKFLIPSGKPFPDGWCRPQNDGPALRAITLMAYAAAKPSIAERAWASIKKELDWVVANYTTSGCDLWEEVQSNDFFWNRYTMRKGLLQGADFAAKVGQDSSREQSYMQTAKDIAAALSNHVESNGFVFEATNRKTDTAVIEAFNVGDMGDGMFAPLSKEVVATLVGLSHYFCKAFALNQAGAKANISGILYGRYEGDGYAGGNPWVLLTASAATLLYRQSEAMSKGGHLDADSEAALKDLLGQDVTAKSLLGAGDAILNRMKTFLTNGMHMNEQIDRNTGVLLSAKDLTWNYANVLKSMKARESASNGISLQSVSVVV